MMTLKTLYAFANKTTLIFEVENTACAPNSPKEVRFFWLYYDKVTHTLSPLSFLAMGNEQQQQTREFQQGRLRFNHEAAQFEPIKQTGKIVLNTCPCPLNNPKLYKQLINLLLAKPG